MTFRKLQNINSLEEHGTSLWQGEQCHPLPPPPKNDVYLKPQKESESHSVMSNSLQSHGLYPSRLLCPWDSPGQNTGVGSHSLFQGIFPTQGLNPDFLHCRQILSHLSHQGSPQILEWLDYPFSRGSSQPRNWTGVSCLVGIFFTSWATREAQRACCFPIRELNPSLSHDRQGYSTTLLRGWQSCSVVSNCLWPRELYSPWNSPDQNIGVGSLSHLQGIFPTQGSNPGLLHCRWILYHLSQHGSPRILKWVAYLFSRGSSWPRNQTRVPSFEGGFFTSWDTREVLVTQTITLFGNRVFPNELVRKRPYWIRRTLNPKDFPGGSDCKEFCNMLRIFASMLIRDNSW